MEMQIQDLVCAIKKDAIDAAQAEAEKIIAEAKKSAASIISEAHHEADLILKKAEKEIDVLKESARTTAEYAKRDAMLFLRNSVQAEFGNLLETDIARSVNSETLARLIVAAINNDDPSNYTAEVSEITDGLKGELAEKLKAGLCLRANPNVRVGFRLSFKDGSGYFDCSDDELEKMLAPFFPELSI